MPQLSPYTTRPLSTLKFNLVKVERQLSTQNYVFDTTCPTKITPTNILPNAAQV